MNLPEYRHPSSVFKLWAQSAKLVAKYWPYFLLTHIVTIGYYIYSYFFPSLDSDPDLSLMNIKSLADFSDYFALPNNLIYATLSLFAYVLSFRLCIDLSRDRKPNFPTLIKETSKYLLPVLGLVIISWSIVFLGSIFLVIPGLFFFFRFLFAEYFLMDQNLGVKESLRLSYRITGKNFMPVMSIVLIYLINVCVFVFWLPNQELLSYFVFVTFSVVPALRYVELTELEKFEIEETPTEN